MRTISFASKGLSDAQYTALVTKFMSAIRSSVSCSSTPSQSLVMHALKDESHNKQIMLLEQANYRLSVTV